MVFCDGVSGSSAGSLNTLVPWARSNATDFQSVRFQQPHGRAGRGWAWTVGVSEYQSSGHAKCDIKCHVVWITK